jgi:N-acetylglutamate synthase-like GNAT family acetyltransferase/8-oxo-dGTP pyrophosphatase MutT (NUDIX family)
MKVRRSSSADIQAIEELIEDAGTKTSLPKLAYNRIDLHVPPEDFPSSWREDRQYVVEKDGFIIGHFLLWSVDERHQYAQIACAFSGVTTEHDVTGAFNDFFDILFRQKNLHKISFLVFPSALFFFTIAQHLSMFLEGTLRQQFAVDNEWYDVAIFSQLAMERSVLTIEGAKRIAVLEGNYDWLIHQASYDNIHVGVVRAIILRIDKAMIQVLLLKKSKQSSFPGVDEAPGGTIVEGESLFNALKRVVLEQTGMQISKDIVYLSSFDFTIDNGQRIREFVFRVRPMTWDVRVNLKDHESFQWLRLQDLPSSHLHPDLIHLLSSYSPTLSFETEEIPVHEHEAAIELVRPPTHQLEETLLIGHHLDAYAAKGLPMIDPIGLVLRDSANRIVGGLCADMAYGCLYIRRIWVDPNWRRVGWGKKLMARVESIAREKGCTFAVGNVMDWEDIPFFQKLGYSIENQHTGYQGASRQFRFRKELVMVSQHS